MEENIYKAPDTDVTTEQNNFDENAEHASRWSRFFAAIIDSVILIVIVIATGYLLGWYDADNIDSDPSFSESLIGSVVWMLAFAVINYKLLRDNGQTIGKIVCGIRIVNVDGSKADMKQHIIKRYATYFLPSFIPGIGNVWSFLNVLTIFAEDRKCIHDHVADTKVVKC